MKNIHFSGDKNTSNGHKKEDQHQLLKASGSDHIFIKMKLQSPQREQQNNTQTNNAEPIGMRKDKV